MSQNTGQISSDLQSPQQTRLAATWLTNERAVEALRKKDCFLRKRLRMVLPVDINTQNACKFLQFGPVAISSHVVVGLCWSILSPHLQSRLLQCMLTPPRGEAMGDCPPSVGKNEVSFRVLSV